MLPHERAQHFLSDDLRAFGLSRGITRDALAAWLGLTCEGMAALERLPSPDPVEMRFAAELRGIAARTGCDPWALGRLLQRVPRPGR